MSLPRVIYIDGQYHDGARARVSVMDRAFLFGDGIYEVIAAHNSNLIDEAGHLKRLDRSLGEIEINIGSLRAALPFIIRQIMRRNILIDGLVYMQVTRGTAPRDFTFPANTAPSLMVTAWPTVMPPPLADKGIAVITIQDIRWQRRDIKSTSMLAQVLGKQRAAQAGVGEAWQIDEEGFITEGCSSNAWIIQNNTIITRPPSHEILKGITRMTLKDIIARAGLTLEERAFSLAEARQAHEAFITGAGALVTPVIAIDGHSIGTGKPGPLTTRLRDSYNETFGLHV